jgi:hypothetical protein
MTATRRTAERQLKHRSAVARLVLLHLEFGRIVVSDTEVPIVLVKLV